MGVYYLVRRAEECDLLGPGKPLGLCGLRNLAPDRNDGSFRGSPFLAAGQSDNQTDNEGRCYAGDHCRQHVPEELRHRLTLL